MTNDVGSRLLVAGTALLALAGLPAVASAQDACANAALAGAGPDCRAPERVTPADKDGRTILEGEPVMAADGRVSFRSFGAFAGNESAPYRSVFQARRSDAGWSVRGIDPLLVNVGLSVSVATVAISDDGTKSVVVAATKLTPDAPEDGTKVYLRDLDDPTSYTLIAATPSTLSEQSLVIDGTPDFSTLTIQSLAPLAPDGQDTFGPIRLYRWSAADGLELVGNTNTLDVDDPADPDDFPTWTDAPRYDESRRTVSEDGGRVTYERATGDSPQTLDREVRQYADGQSRLVSHPAGQPTTPANGTSPIASPDGRTVTFVGGDPLTAGSAPEGQSLYRWTDDDTVVDLLAGLDGRDAVLRGLTVEAVSPDGQLVWFRATSSVVYGNNPGGGLYALDTTTGTLTQSVSLDASAASVLRFSPDGRVVAFTSPGDTYGQPTVPECTEGRECAYQVFTLDAHPGAYGLQCLTCTGSPAGAVDIDKAAAPQRSTAVLDDGRVFFDARARLTSQDENAEFDVYQYTPNRTTPGGTTVLLSSGKGPYPALFGGATPDGKDVFIVTQSQLVPADDDDRTDVYTSRAGGGLAAQQVRPTSAEPCRGDACKPPATPVPATPAPVNEGSNEPPPPAPPKPPAFSVSTPSASALRSAARRGTLSVRVRVGASGTISAGLRGKVSGRTRTLGSRTVRVRKGGSVTLRLRLSKATRTALRRRGTLRAQLTVAYSERTNRVRKTITLKGGRR